MDAADAQKTPVISAKPFLYNSMSYVWASRRLQVSYFKNCDVCYSGVSSPQNSLNLATHMLSRLFMQSISVRQVCLSVGRDWKSWPRSQRNIILNSICSAAFLFRNSQESKNNFSCQLRCVTWKLERERKEGVERIQGGKLVCQSLDISRSIQRTQFGSCLHLECEIWDDPAHDALYKWRRVGRPPICSFLGNNVAL